MAKTALESSGALLEHWGVYDSDSSILDEGIPDTLKAGFEKAKITLKDFIEKLKTFSKEKTKAILKKIAKVAEDQITIKFPNLTEDQIHQETIDFRKSGLQEFTSNIENKIHLMYLFSEYEKKKIDKGDNSFKQGLENSFKTIASQTKNSETTLEETKDFCENEFDRKLNLRQICTDLSEQSGVQIKKKDILFCIFWVIYSSKISSKMPTHESVTVAANILFLVLLILQTYGIYDLASEAIDDYNVLGIVLCAIYNPIAVGLAALNSGIF